MRIGIIIGVSLLSALMARLLILYDLDELAAFYLGVPMLASTVLFWTDAPERRVIYRRHGGEATLILFCTAIVLYEGFVCFIFAAPIYYIAVSLSFYINLKIFEAKTRKTNRTLAATLPLLALMLGAEGMTAATTLDRQNAVTHQAVTAQSIAQLKANMAQPINFDAPRHWFISVFPKPVSVKAGTLEAGDVHVLDFVYKRWFFTNVHSGHMKLRIEDVGRDFVKTKIVGNTSYLSSYLTIHGTHVQFNEQADGTTAISLTLHYDRKLDPVWYFAPLQYFAMSKTAEYLVETIITRDGADG